MRLETGKNLLGIEGEIAWVTPGAFTVHNFPCAENGDNCVADQPGRMTQFYQDPAHSGGATRFERLGGGVGVGTPAAAREKRLRA